MFEKMAARGPFAAVVTAALEEARRRGDRRLGTEHLFLGLLHDPDSAKALGVELESARAALDILDHEALKAIGLDLGEPQSTALRRHPPLKLSALTSGARAVLDQAVKATTAKTRHTGPEYLLRALLTCEPPDVVAELITRLDVDRQAVL
ncbi:Clp protease N-terminal domain-containing protein [Amycolatopsis sp.]|jgi:ATP-dependent Clp protease ATP-binding subunit ClpA|uniref:Clp protease N-terminal domain-containing protein n=1 Tax=Amycolatopsis sp. TaxID=37632 RepID=UPI002DFD28CA|nr:Clp protease N-terminal domain-containing protein [Amycolatopsis sp.]